MDGTQALNLEEAGRLIREIAGHYGNVRFTKHAREELAADNLDYADAYACLRACRVTRCERDVKFGNWKYIAEGRSGELGIAAVVVIVEEHWRIKIVTVWRS